MPFVSEKQETVDVVEQTGDSAKMDEQVQESSETLKK